MSSTRSTISVSTDAVERLREVQKFLEEKNGFNPSITQVIDYLIKVENKVRLISEEK
jgi:3-deoxy-D-manno-octulosonate 8-phosphate phosphatase KdsC-like HAD superfamily phosphatase